LFLARLIGKSQPAKCVVLDGCYWEEGTRQLDSLLAHPPAVGYDRPARYGRSFAHTLISMLRKPNIYFVVYGSDERLVFAERWSIPRDRVFWIPYHANPWCEAIEPQEQTPTDGYVFAGGNSLRDYRPLIAAASQIPAKIRIASSLIMPPLPSNVEACVLSEQEYRQVATRARVHVVSSIKNVPRSTGQASYLSAMLLGVPVVVTDGLAVADHLRHGEDALIVPPGDAAAMADAVCACLQDTELRARLSTQGRAHAMQNFAMAPFCDRQYRQMCEIWRAHEHRLSRDPW